jgi:antitoxin (DNA-binding transcriptional repressor) of toxin-antitoxin stability system
MCCDMAKTSSPRAADRSSTRCIRKVEAGEDFVITRDRKPVARPSPVTKGRMPATVV